MPVPLLETKFYVPSSRRGLVHRPRLSERLDREPHQRRGDGLTLTRESDGSTLIEGPVVDQAALHGLLQKVRDIGLPLVSVRQVDPGGSDATQA